MPDNTPTTDTSAAQGVLSGAQNAQVQNPLSTPSANPGGSIDSVDQNQTSGVGTHGINNEIDGRWSGGGSGFMGKVERGIVNAGGHGPAEYDVNDSGAMIKAATDATPGTLFKNLLVGALSGMAGASKSGTHGLADGAAAGFTADQARQEEQDKDARAQAIQKYQVKQAKKTNDYEQQRIDMEKGQFDVANAHWNTDNLLHQHQADLTDQEHIEQQNDQHQNMLDHAMDVGGKSVPIKDAAGKDINGQLGNGTALMTWAAQPGNMKSPTGGHLKLTSVTDTSAMAKDGVKYDLKAGFYKDKDGTRVDLDKYTAHYVVDVPPNAAKASVTVSKKELAGLGIVTDAPMTTMNFDTYAQLSTNSQNRRVEVAGQELQKQMALYGEINGRLTSLAESRDKILNDPMNIAKPGSVSTSSIDKEISTLSGQRDVVGKRFGMIPQSASPTAVPEKGGSAIPQGAMVAKNPSTGEVRFSTDGGKTWKSAGAQASSSPDPNEKVQVKRPDGSTGIMTRAEYQDSVDNPPAGVSRASMGTIVGPAQAAPVKPLTMDLTKGNSY